LIHDFCKKMLSQIKKNFKIFSYFFYKYDIIDDWIKYTVDITAPLGSYLLGIGGAMAYGA